MKKQVSLFISFFLVLSLGILFTTNIYRQQQDIRSKAAGTYVSMLFYPGWDQANTPPSGIDYTAWTYIMHFGFHPTSSGGIELGDMSNSSYPAAAISAAHAAGRKIIYTVGGEGTGDAFVGAVQTTNMDKFVTAIVNNMKQYGYDGIDIDWEENVNGAQLVTLMSKLRTEINKISPRPLLSIDVEQDLTSPADVAKLQQYVDYVNVMSYMDTSTSQIDAFANAGVPYNKITFGMGFNDGGIDTSAARVQTKVDAAKSKGMAGVMAWSIEGLSGKTDSKLPPIRALVAGNSVVTPTPTVKPVTPSSNPTLIMNPTTTPTTGDSTTYLTMNLFLHGIGNAGDSVNPSAVNTDTPKTPQRTVTIAFYKLDNTFVLSHDGTVTYDANSGSFTGTSNMGSLKTLTAGNYTLRIKVNKYLPFDIPTQVKIPENGGTFAIPNVNLVTGDIRNDNKLDILDYTDLLKCYSDLSSPASCSDTEKQLADITDDGLVNQFDYNLLLREFSGQK